MKFILTTICLVAAALFLISCGGENTDTEQAAETTTAEHPGHGHSHGQADHTEDHAEAHTAATADDGLVLNDGKKWQMDEHTRTSFAKMAASFVDADLTALDTEGLKAAGTGLMADLNGLIQGCTMTGPDHDQLHVYLMAYIPAVTDLEKNGQVADAKMVQHYLSIYGDYFE